MNKGTTATLLTVCAALAACESASTRDLTAPNPGGARLATAALGTGRHKAVRPDGSSSFISGTRASLRVLGGDVSVAANGTTECNNAVITILPTGPDIDVTVPFDGTYDNVEVPPDGVCVLFEATVTNWVRALAGSHLFIGSSQVGGNVEGLSARTVQVHSESTVGGNMDVRNAGGGPFASCTLTSGSTVSGNVSCTGNDPGSPIIRGDPFIPPRPPNGEDEDDGDPGQPERRVTVGGSVTLERNVIPPGNVLLLQLANVGNNADVNKNTGGGFKSVDNNTVAKTLECKKNDPTFVGGPNVANKTKGQCF